MPGTFAAPLDMKRIAAALATLCLLLTGLAPTTQQAERFVSVIVQGISPAAVEDAVESVGGEVTQPLPIVNGGVAGVPAGTESSLRGARGIFNVTANDPIEFQGEATTGQRIQKVVGSHKLWESGIDGSGVTVAVLDTGIYAGHPDLAGRVIHCEDLSSERGSVADCADTFGHGTFMAGLVAGNGAASGGKYKGTAPGANLVAIKAAGFDGSSDVAHVLAGIQWAVAFKDTYNIRVLNLSLGTDSAQDYRLSPLNFAVERAWLAGIVVVVSAGNTGPNSATIMKPGDDPFVITVGSSSDMGTNSTGDDVVTGFSGRGPTRSNGLAKPDIVAPGMHTVSLRSPGSAIDQKYPGSVHERSYFRGSGTSMSTATVSGVVAQMLDANPRLTPDQVKARLTGTTRTISSTDATAVGSGQVDAYGAATTAMENPQEFTLSTGLGSLALDRGSLAIDVQTKLGPVSLTGEFVANTSPEVTDLISPAGLVPWNGTNWTGTNWTGTNWTGTNWTGTNWTGTNWTNADWTGTNWTGTNWTGTNWTGTNWTSAWYAVAWD